MQIQNHAQIQMVEIKKIVPNDYNPNEMPEELFEGIKNNIKRTGFVGAIVVRPTKKGKYVIIDGEHRYKALKRVGAKEVPCIVMDLDDSDAKINTIAWNKLRGTANPIKLAHAIHDLTEYYSMEQLEKLTGYRKAELNDVLKLLKLPTEFRDLAEAIEMAAQEETDRAPVIMVFVVDQDQERTILEAVERTKMKKKGDALFEICSKYVEAHHEK